MDPVSAASSVIAVDKTAKQVFNVITGEAGGYKKIDGGVPAQEMQCEEFMAYVAVEGGFTRKHCMRVPSRDAGYSGPGGAMTLGDLRQQYAKALFASDDASSKKELRQRDILDHDRYQLQQDLPVYLFSNRCRVSAIFTESRASALTGFATDAVGSVTETAVGAVGTVAGTAKNVVTAPIGWFTSKPSQ